MLILNMRAFFLLCTLHRASSKMKMVTWGFNFKKILNIFLKANISKFYFFVVNGINLYFVLL